VYNSLTKSQTQYVYDASGGRVAKASFTGTFPPKNTVCAAPGAATGFTLTAQYLLDQGGDQVTELNGSGAWQHSNVWAGSHLDATYDAKGLHFHLADPLGTRRIQTNIDGQVEESCQSLPFGDNLNCTTTALTTADDATEHHFTQKERDVESGNDYFGARYYSSTMGRFMSPDWSAQEEPIPYAKLDDPQTLNLYAYVQNNPLSSTDADGHCGGPGEDSCGSRYSVDDVSNIVANEDGGLQEITGSGATLHELYTDLTHAIFNGEKLNKQPENAGTSDPQKMDPTRMADIKKDVQAACTAAKKGADTVSGADKFNNQFGKSKDTRTFTGPYGTSKAPVVKNDGPYLIPYNKKKTFEAFTRQKEEKLQPKPKPKGKKSKNQGGE
jgi:RHS repeat-associated protein